MADVLIRNLEEETLEILKSKAKKNNRSLQGELHEMVKTYVYTDKEETVNMVREALLEYRAKGRTFSDSVSDLREDRNR